MKKVTLLSNGNRKTILCPETATPREIFEQNGMSYSGRITLDSNPLSAGNLDMPIGQLTASENVYLASVAKTENAASARISGGACVVTSTVTRADYELVQKYQPEAMTLYSDEKKTDPYFGVLLGDGYGSIDNNGAVFGAFTDNEGHATITMTIPNNKKDGIAKYVEDVIGRALLNLDKIEAAMPEVLTQIHADQAKVQEHITVD